MPGKHCSRYKGKILNAKIQGLPIYILYMIEIFVKYFEKDLQNQNKSIKFAPRKITKTYKAMKQSVKMLNRIMKIVSPWTNNLDECDGRNLNGVAITIDYQNESVKEAPARFWDYAEITIQDVRWDGSSSRHERDTYIVAHDGTWHKY